MAGLDEIVGAGSRVDFVEALADAIREGPARFARQPFSSALSVGRRPSRWDSDRASRPAANATGLQRRRSVCTRPLSTIVVLTRTGRNGPEAVNFLAAVC